MFASSGSNASRGTERVRPGGGLPIDRRDFFLHLGMLLGLTGAPPCPTLQREIPDATAQMIFGLINDYTPFSCYTGKLGVGDFVGTSFEVPMVAVEKSQFEQSRDRERG